MVTETDVELPDGRTVHVYDTAGEDGRLAVLWHHGTPNLGPPPEPLFAVMGHSGGSDHALACGALLPGRVLGAVCMSGLAPLHAEGLDWFAGMAGDGRPDHLGRAVAAAGGRPRLGPRLGRGGPRLAPGPRQRGLSPVRRSGPGVPQSPAVDGDGPDHDDVDDDNEH